jgi:hypothetical protein
VWLILTQVKDGVEIIFAPSDEKLWNGVGKDGQRVLTVYDGDTLVGEVLYVVDTLHHRLKIERLDRRIK